MSSEPLQRRSPPSEDVSVSQEAVLQALRQWHNLTYSEPTLAELYLVRRHVRETNQLLHHAINEIVGRALTDLAQTHGQEAELLTLRFLEGHGVEQVANFYNVSISRFHSWQREALSFLTAILNHLENNAWLEQEEELLSRLEAATNNELIGVEAHIAHLLDLVDPSSKQWIIAIEGIGGIGKTALSDATMRRVIADRIYDEVAWVTARDKRMNPGGLIVSHPQPKLTAAELIEGLAEQLIPQSVYDRSLSHERLLGLLRRQLKQWPHLIVIDNLETVVDLETLLPILDTLANPSTFLLSSREALYSANNVFHFRVPELDLTHSVALIRSEIATRNLSALTDWDDAAFKSIAAVTGGNPLAIRLVVGQAHIYDLRHILTQLKDVRSDSAENLFAYIYRHSWQQLSDDERHLLLTMPLMNPNGDSIDMLAELSALKREVVERAIGRLVMISLVDVKGTSVRQYRIHGLTRTFLVEQILEETANETAARQVRQFFDEALVRGLQFILRQSAEQESNRSSADNSVLFDNTTRDRALNLLNYALPRPLLWTETRTVLLALIPGMERSGQRDYWIPYLERGVEQSQEQRDATSEATLALAIGELYRLRSNYKLSRQWLERSIQQFTNEGDNNGLARALNQLAYLTWRQHHYDETVALAKQALALSTEPTLERAMSLSALGLVATDRLQWPLAEEHHRQALEIRVTFHDERQIAWSLQNLASALRGQERYDDAIDHYLDAIERLDSVRDPLNCAVARLNLGIVYSLQGRSDEALTVYRAAERAFREIGDTFHLAKSFTNIGIEYLALQAWAKAEDSFIMGSQLFASLGDRNEYLNAVDGLGMAYLGQGLYDQALLRFEEVKAGLPEITPDSYFYEILHPDKINAQIAEAHDGKHRPSPITTDTTIEENVTIEDDAN